MYKGPNGQMVYPQDIECIMDSKQGKGGIFIGNLQASQNINTLKKHSIKGVLTSAKGVFLNHPKHQVPHQLYIPGQDHDRFDLSKYFDQAADWIREKLQQTNVLVHCLAGVSRSVSLVIAYLIKHRNMNFEDAYFMIKSRRKIIHPNDGFKRQLRDYQQKIGSGASYSPQRRHGIQLSPERSRYYNNISPKKYNEPASYARQAFSPTKKYEYKYFDSQRRTNFERQNLVRNPQGEQRTILNSYNFDDIDKKIEERRQSLGLTGRTKAFSDYNKVDTSCNNNVNNQRRALMGSMVGPLSNYDKKTSYQAINDDLDKRISEIRKKYQDYTESNLNRRHVPNNSNSRPASGMIYDNLRNFQERSTNISGLDSYKSKNESVDYSLGSIEDRLKMRKIQSMHQDYEKGDGFSGSNYRGNIQNHDYHYVRNKPSTGANLRKMLSYQQY